jgi:heat shock protein HslJ
MGCEEAVMAAEGAWFDALSKVAEARIDGETLILLDAGGESLLVLVKRSPE